MRSLDPSLAAAAASLVTPELVSALASSSWPGNVRELRNYLQRCLVLQQPLPVSDDHPLPVDDEPVADPGMPYSDARRRAILGFERNYLKALREQHRRNVGQAARASGIHKVYLYRLLHRHGLMDD